MKYLLLPYILLALLTIACRTQEEKFEASYKKAVTLLWDQQSPDGGWHSETHAVLRDGIALTPYILYYLMQVSDTVYEKDETDVEKSIEFIRRSAWHSLSLSKDSLQLINYPNYSAAYVLRILCLTNTDTALQQKLVKHLLQEQFTESRGILPSNLAYGGWGYGEPDLPFGTHGHVDLSHTRRITEALLEIQPPDPLQRGSLDISTSLNVTANNSPPLKRCAELVEVGAGGLLTYDSSSSLNEAANNSSPLKGVGGLSTYTHSVINSQFIRGSVISFLQSVQRSPTDTRPYEGCTDRSKIPYDGGFVSSMATLSTNKCQPIEIDGAGLHYPSYATATCDGLLALHALGLKDSDAYRDAVKWLSDHQRIDVIDGLSPDDPEQWYQVMHYYHWAVRTEAMRAAGIQGTWEEDLRKGLINEQQPNGSYFNPIGGVNKEDDPLMATVFCVQAFTAISQNH